MANDVVVEQVDTAYDKNSNVIQTATHERFSTDPQSGANAVGPLGYAFGDISTAQAAYSPGPFDSSGHGDSGTSVGGVTSNSGGPTGSYNTFDGSTGYIDAGNPANLNFAGQITISAWVNISDLSVGKDEGLVVHSASGQATFLKLSFGTFQAGGWNGTGNNFATYNIPSGDVGQWVQLVATYDGSNWSLYHNGTLVATEASSLGALSLSGGDWTIGGSSNAMFKGSIADVRIFNTALSAQAVALLYTSQPGARVYYMGYFYDPADRLTDTVNPGTDGGNLWTRPSTVPAGSSTLLVNHNDFDPAGNLLDTIDPAGIKTGYQYDLLGRTTETINNWDGTQNPTPTSTANQITRETFDGIDDVLSMKAVLPSGSQETDYIYGIGGTSGLNLFSNDVIQKIEYPDKTSGAPATVASEQQSFGYNLLGEETSFTDQNGTSHTYLRDALGRLTSDIITLPTGNPMGIDQSVMRLGFSYNGLGLPFKQTSYSDASGISIVNQVEDLYNGFGQLTTEYQEHSGQVNTSTTPKVQYAYSTGDNNSRLTTLTYPGGRVEVYTYADALNNAISRIDGIDDGAANHLRIYQFLGLSTAVAFDGNNVSLTYLREFGDTRASTDGGDEYTGIDRFGRIIDQNWTGPGGTSIDRFQYGYDADSNVLFKNNLINPNFSELYAYDPLNRLTAFTRGTLNAAHTAITSQNPLAGSSNNWNLDAIGNITSSNGTSRSVNSANELTSVGSNGLAYDNNGNTLTDQNGNTYVYDAWNHVVKVNGTYAYKYDAVGRRIYEGTTGKDLYYNSIGNVIEERNASNSTTMQYVWGMGYVNDLVLLDNYSTGVRLYAEQDANWNVTSLTDSNGNVVERFVYDPYGTRTVLSSTWNATTDAYGMLYGFQGGRQDPVTGLIHFENRDENPGTGTWNQREPFGGAYIDGMNLYEFTGSDPIDNVDPSGLTWYEPWTWLTGLGASIGNIVGNAKYGHPYQDAIDAAVNGTPQAQRATRRQLEGVVDDARAVAAAAARMPGTGTGGPLVMPDSAAGSLAGDAEAIGRDAAAARAAGAGKECPTGVPSCFAAGTPELVVLPRGQDPAAALADAGLGRVHRADDSLWRRELALDLILVGVYGAYLIRRVNRMLMLKRSEEELGSIEPLEIPLGASTRVQRSPALSFGWHRMFGAVLIE
ncbi:MAG TPA: LamG-like jellyroll fold domain-containing protein [Tepidisphaeraceae bacterium]|nr:LamG-like jellyroll fold domain-containing protein [Tepidisphaeraceae bacterium]